MAVQGARQRKECACNQEAKEEVSHRRYFTATEGARAQLHEINPKCIFWASLALAFVPVLVWWEVVPRV